MVCILLQNKIDQMKEQKDEMSDKLIEAFDIKDMNRTIEKESNASTQNRIKNKN